MVDLTVEQVRSNAPTGDGPPSYSRYQLTLAALSFPVLGRCIFAVVAGVCLALLGHPILALAWTLVSCAADGLMQRGFERALRTSMGADEARGFRRLGVVAVLRTCLHVGGPLTALALGGGPEVLVFMSLVAAMCLLLSIANSRLSRDVFLGQAVPSLLAIGAGGYLAFGPGAGSALLLGVGALTGVLLLIRSITQESATAWQGSNNTTIQLVGELREARDQALVERQAADEAREEARNANQAKSNFLATMSHEIRTPMNGVLGMAQLLRRAEKNPAQIERIDTLIHSGEFLLAILNDILDVSKIDAGRLELSPQAEDLTLFVTRLASFWRPRADEKLLKLDIRIDDSAPPYVWMDALRVRQVLSNLIGNAIKFTDEGAITLTVSGEPLDADRVLIAITVADTGVGIEADDLPALFERFSQADDFAARKFGGTGLGLAIARQLTELMGGHVRVESTPGVGSSFRIELPLAIAQATGQAAAAADDDVDMAGHAALKVLAVDDNAVNLMVLDQLLPAFGHSVVTAQSGAEALQRLADQVFDVVLLDIQMPGMSGVEVINALRAGDSANRAAPVVALTADVTSGGREKYLALGFDEHAAKPIEIVELMGAINRAVARTGRPERQRTADAA